MAITDSPPASDVHELLRRQVEQHLGPDPALPPGWDAFVREVSAAYAAADHHRAEHERLLALAAERDAAAVDDQQFRTLAETVAAATFIYTDTRFLYVNAASEALTGYTREELLRMEPWEVVHPDHRALVRERGLARLRGEEAPTGYEVKIVRKDGTERWVELTGGLVTHGGHAAALGTAFDVTARKAAEEALRRQALTFENLYDAVIITDLGGRITHWNPAAERMYGYAEAEALGKTVRLWLHPAEAERLDAQIGESLEAEGRWSGEIRFLRSDGTTGLSETVVVPLLDEGGARVGALGVSRDATDRRRTEEALKSSEERFRLMVAGSARVFYYVHDAEGRYEYLSPSVKDVLGYAPEELAGRPYHWLHVGHPTDAEVDRLTRETMAAPDRLSTYLAYSRHKDGRTVALELVETAVRRGSRVRGVQGFARDVTERIRAEEALVESEERYRSLFEESRDAIYMSDLAGRVIAANQAALDLFGYGRDEIIGGNVGDLYLHEADRQRFRDEILRAGYVRDYELRLRRSDGDVVDTLLSATIRRGRDGRPVGFQGIIHDITARKKVEEALAYGALHDALTGLPNRALFVDRLQHAIDRVRRGGEGAFAVLFLDLDRFKVVNDSLGHGVGDQMLVAMAQRLLTTLRAGDTVARFGGDEFTLLLDDVGSAVEATHVAERILDTLSAPFTLDRHEVFATASVGIAVSTTGHEAPDELLRNADAALSRAKALGKNRYEVFDREMHAEAMERLSMEMDLRRSLDRGELVLLFQPIVELASGRVCGFEALVRWDHPERGMLQPATFIPMAEETGLVLPLGRWVVEEACRQLRRWNDLFGEERQLSVSVNLSARQFSQPDLARYVEDTLGECRVDPRRFRLEITESAILDQGEPAMSLLGALRELGVGLSMDDFGTGYSSLGYLHRLHLDQLKIDRSFVARMNDDTRSAQLVQAIIALAGNLGVAVVAEGVETEEQLAALRALGCGYAQGFLFARPLTAAAAEALLESEPRW